MSQAAENRVDIAATVASLSAEAATLQTRADELRRELRIVDERMSAVVSALRLHSPS